MRMTATIPLVPELMEAILEGFVLAAELQIRAGLVPPFPHDVKGLIWKKEPKGSEDWKLPDHAMRDGEGDCEDLALWHAGGLRATEEDPGARVIIVRTGEHTLHAIVELSTGVVFDPSRELKPPRVQHAM